MQFFWKAMGIMEWWIWEKTGIILGELKRISIHIDKGLQQMKDMNSR